MDTLPLRPSVLLTPTPNRQTLPPRIAAFIVPKLSVIIPALNEEATIGTIVDAVVRTGLAYEIIVVDDGSTDGTFSVLRQLEKLHPRLLRALRHVQPHGKGAAIRTALDVATGDIVLIQDADLEYAPSDFPALLKPFNDPAVDAVYGSRNLKPDNPRSSFTFYWGGRLLSWIASTLFHARITDESTGYKLVRTDVIRRCRLKATGFDFCPELTGRLLRRGITIHEVPISYRPRSVAEGKKIRWRDGAIAVFVLLRERLRRSSATTSCARSGGALPIPDAVAAEELARAS